MTKGALPDGHDDGHDDDDVLQDDLLWSLLIDSWASDSERAMRIYIYINVYVYA